MRSAPLSLLLAAFSLGCAGSDAPTSSNEALSAFDAAATAARQTPRSAVMQFGDNDAGSPFHPATGHDRSLHAKDKIVPRTVVVSVGGTVRFEVQPSHRVVIYDKGTRPQDIVVSPATLITLGGIPNFGINDPNGRIAIQPIGDYSFVNPSTFEHTFTAPGRYLVICGVTPHFLEGDMYGWVIVQ